MQYCNTTETKRCKQFSQKLLWHVSTSTLYNTSREPERSESEGVAKAPVAGNKSTSSNWPSGWPPNGSKLVGWPVENRSAVGERPLLKGSFDGSGPEVNRPKPGPWLLEKRSVATGDLDLESLASAGLVLRSAGLWRPKPVYKYWQCRFVDSFKKALIVQMFRSCISH